MFNLLIEVEQNAFSQASQALSNTTATNSYVKNHLIHLTKILF